MKIHEYQATELFQKAGVAVVSGQVATDVREALRVAESIGYPVVLKSQVLVGGRGKAGGIKKVNTPEELTTAFAQLKALKIKDYPVEKVLVVRAVAIKREFYIGMTVDTSRNDVVLIASAAGGVDIEETAQKDPQAIKKYYLEGNQQLVGKKWQSFIESVFDDPHYQVKGAEIFRGLIKVFFAYDCSLAEINPLVIDDKGQMYAADAKINFDDNALFRHEDVAALRDIRYEEPDEMEAKKHGLSFVRLDGNVGCIVNGAGLAMATMDIVNLSGGAPANFLDVGGSSNPEKVVHALRIILNNKKVKAVLINIFGGITRCDDIARGLVEARTKLNLSVPLVVRLIGTNEEEAKALLAQHNIRTYPTMREAISQVVAIANQ
ncbi:MAG TPA: ADP-forming succinate--CoA ligase subunit beta [Candidatus Omnitrophica bacterium]|nr:ADP-forming succinate--CoA ligase subunit beta [Candidatus Omnitrophota bacterium]